MVASILSGLFSASFGKFVNSLISWIANTVVYSIAQILIILNNQTEPDIFSQNFNHYLRLMELTTAGLMLPLVMFAIIKHLITQNSQGLIKLATIDIPVSLMGTAIAIILIKYSLQLVDNLCAMYLSSAGVDMSKGLNNLGHYLLNASNPGTSHLPGFFTLVILLIFAAGFFGLVFEMIIRSAAIELAVLFLPLGFMGLIWPSTSHWLRKMIDLIVSLIISKLVVVVVISLAIGQLISDSSVTVGSMLTALAMLLLSVFSPFLLMHIIPAMEHFGNISQMGHSFKDNMTQKASKAAQLAAGGGLTEAAALESVGAAEGAKSVIDSNLSQVSDSFENFNGNGPTGYDSSASENFGAAAGFSDVNEEMYNAAYEDILAKRKAAGLDLLDE